MMNRVVTVSMSIMGAMVIGMMFFSFVYMYVATQTMFAIIGG